MPGSASVIEGAGEDAHARLGPYILDVRDCIVNSATNQFILLNFEYLRWLALFERLNGVLFQDIVLNFPQTNVKFLIEDILWAKELAFSILVDEVVDFELILVCQLLIHAHLWINERLLRVIFLFRGFCGREDIAEDATSICKELAETAGGPVL